MRPDPDRPPSPDADPDSPSSSWFIAQSLLVLIRVIGVVALAVALFLLVFLGYITFPLVAPIMLGVGYAAVLFWRRTSRRR